MTRLLTISLLILASGLFTGFADRELFHRGYCQEEHWKNKYAQPLEEAPDTWYYRTFSLKYKEAFPLSATLLVSWTDAWHRWKALTWASIRLALVLGFMAVYVDAFHLERGEQWALGAALYVSAWAVQALGFHIIYTWNIF